MAVLKIQEWKTKGEDGFFTSLLRPGDVLKIQKASLKKSIKSWASITTQFCATKYNIGDALYAKKLDYCLTLIK